MKREVPRVIGSVVAATALVLGTIQMTHADISASVDERSNRSSLVSEHADPDVPGRFLEAIEVAEGEVPSLPKPEDVPDVQVSGDGQGSVATPLGEVTVAAVDSESAVALVRDDGVQVLTELTEGESWTDFEVDLPTGVEMQETDEGSIDLVVQEDDGPRLVVGEIEPPWAVDAEGDRLVTRYEVTKDRIRQVIDTSDATYPVIADPRLTYGWGVYLNLWGAEVKALAGMTYTAGAVASIAVCSLKNLPHLVGKVVTALCIVVGGSSVISIMKNLTKLAKSKKIDAASCYQTKLIPRNNTLKKVKIKGNCIA